MKVGIIGFARSGKTTVFNALTGAKTAVGAYGSREANVAVIKVPDARVDALSDIFKPKKRTYAEIEFLEFAPGAPRIVDYAAKWDPASHAYHHTPRRYEFPPTDEALLGELRTLALRCWEVFGLAGYARVDFRVDEAGRPWVLEVNTNPCLSADAGFMAAAHQAGLVQRDVVGHLVEGAVRLAKSTR